MLGDRVCININCENGPYLRLTRAEAGRFSFSTFVNLVGDALAHMLNSAKKEGNIIGLVPRLVEGGLIILSYSWLLMIKLSKILSLNYTVLSG